MCTGQAIMGAQGFGAGMSAVGAYFGALNEQRSLRHQAVMADLNARIAEGNARNTIYAGVVEESRVKLHGAQEKGAQIARITGDNIDIEGSPTALARLTSTDLITEVDANMVRSNALRAAWGHRFEAGNARRTATSLRASASGINPLMAGGTSLLNSVGTVAASWYGLNKEGAFDRANRTGDDGHGDLLSNWSFGGGEEQAHRRRASRSHGGAVLQYGEGY